MAGGNYDRSNRGGQLNPAVSYCFGLQVEAAFFVPVKSVRVFTKENEFDYYQEGGLNDYVHMFRKPISKPFTFQVERYVGCDAGLFDTFSNFLDPLALGTDLALPVILYVNRAQTKNAGDNFDFKNCARAYIFTGCTVTSKEYGELNSEQSKLLTETTTIAYRELFCINQIDPSWQRGKVWEFPKDIKNYLGGGEAHKENRAVGNASRTDQESKANSDRFQIGTDFPTGNGKFHMKHQLNPDKAAGDRAGHHNKWGYPGSPDASTSTNHMNNRAKDNMSKADLIAKADADRWQIDKDAYGGNEKYHTSELGRKNPDKSAGQETGNRGKWAWPGTPEDHGAKHDQNRAKNNDSKSDSESKGNANQWLLNKDNPTGGGKNREENRAKGNPSKSDGESAGEGNTWIWTGDAEGSGTPHELNHELDNDTKDELVSKGEANKWIWDGTSEGSGKSHPENRSKNTKPTPVIWPPTRRALMAQALSDLS